MAALQWPYARHGEDGKSASGCPAGLISTSEERDERLKAVVAQIVGRHAVLLTENGTFVKVKNLRYHPGQQIAFCQKRKRLAKPLVIAASFMIFLLGGTYLAAERLPYSYVSMDVNPSIEYTLNWFDRVFSLRAVNEDANPIVRRLTENGVMNQPIDMAISMTIKSLDDMQYFSDDSENDVLIAVASLGLKDVSSLSERLEGSAGSALPDQPLAVTAFQTDRAKVQEAQQYHTTAGKLVIVENLAGSGNGFADEAKEDWLKKPVREILGHENSDAKTKTDEKKPENPGHATDHAATLAVHPEETGSPPSSPPGKADPPKQTDPPKQKQDKPNIEKDKPVDATPNEKEKPKNSPAPEHVKQEPKNTTPPKGGNGRQEKERETNKPPK